jgi:outer membrane protein insertion porin family
MIAFILLFFGSVEFQVARIDIQGNQFFKDSAIKNVMLIKTPALFRKGKFVQKVFEGDIAAIKYFYNYRGFLGAEVNYELLFDSTKKTVDITIDINEGNQTFVSTIKFIGNTLFNDDFLKSKLTTKSDEPFDKRKLEVDSYIITSLYDDQGYADAVVKSDYAVSDHQTVITHRISEQEKQYVEKIDFIGLARTRNYVVEREVTLKCGSLFRYANILQSQRRLYNLGVFRSIRIQTKNSARSNFKIVQFILKEKEPMIINFRIGYGTQDYLRVGAGFTHLNVFGRAWHGIIETKASFAEYNVNTKLTFPRFLIFPVRYSIGAYYQLKKEIGFKTRSIGSYNKASFDLKGGKFSTVYDLENIRTYYTDSDSIDDDWVHGFGLNWLRDKRDDPLITKNGYYININFETSGIILPSDVDYIRPTFEYRIFKPISVFTGATSFKIGMVTEIAPSTNVPMHKRFYCGGTTSVRGYSLWSIGAKDDNDNPLGGRALFEASGELRIPLYKIFGAVVFVDAGNVWQGFDEINGALRWGIGAGLRLNTPLGSIRLDYGVKLGRAEGESSGAFHFAIGEAF